MRFSLTRWMIPVACLALFVPTLASARVTDATTGLGATGRAAGLSTACSGSATQCVATLLGRILNVVLGFLGIILLGYVLYGGFVWMTAGGGNPKEIQKAQEIIRNAVIGVIIIASSFAVSSYVITQVGQIAGGGDGSSLAGGSGGVGPDGQPSLDTVMDGATRPCCYARTADASSAPMTACVNDCQRTPTAFGLAAGATTDACVTACGPRLCPGTVSGLDAPAPGQSVCTPGAPAPGTPGGAPAPFTLAGYCTALRATPISRYGTERCNRCVNDCVQRALCASVADASIMRARASILRESDATNQEGFCRNTTCTLGTAPACSTT